MRELRDYDGRTAALAHRLAVAARPYCRVTAPTFGLSFDAIDRYTPADRAAAARELGLGEGVEIAAAAPGSSGEIAGLRPGDVVVAVADRPLPVGVPDTANHARTAWAEAALKAAGTEPLALRVRRGGAEFGVLLAGELGCDVHLILSSREGRSTFTDGHDIDLPAGLFRFAGADDEVAFAAAHEVAHAIFNQHRVPSRALGHKRQTEIHADALGAALLAAAGYDPAAAERFWRRFAARDPFGFLRSRSHPPTGRRLTAVTETVAALRAGQPPGALIGALLAREIGAGQRAGSHAR